MHFFLLTIEEARQSSDTWGNLPEAPLRTLMECEPTAMMSTTEKE
jgi:hypothetical protein